jgi:hypothetical protein
MHLPLCVTFMCNTNHNNNQQQPQEFFLLSRSDEQVTQPATTLHFQSCQQCGRSVCDSNTSVLQWAVGGSSGGGAGGSVHVTSSQDLVLPPGWAALAPPQDLEDCDVLNGRGVSFLTLASASSQAVAAVPRTYPVQSTAYVYPLPSGRHGAGSIDVGSSSIIYATSVGLAYFADQENSRVSLGMGEWAWHAYCRFHFRKRTAVCPPAPGAPACNLYCTVAVARVSSVCAASTVAPCGVGVCSAVYVRGVTLYQRECSDAEPAACSVTRAHEQQRLVFLSF